MSADLKCFNRFRRFYSTRKFLNSSEHPFDAPNNNSSDFSRLLYARLIRFSAPIVRAVGRNGRHNDRVPPLAIRSASMLYFDNAIIWRNRYE